jgi:DNA modification methylase
MSEPRWRIVQADLRTADMVQLVGSGYHAVLCDPPYGLSPDGKARTWDDLDGAEGRGFMGKAWDAAVPGATFWRGVLRVLRPGAHVVAFGGTRTYHRLACAVEDAGFEVRDMLSYLYGSGFPKSLNVRTATNNEVWSGYGTALKPACEPAVLARKPLSGTVAANALEHGCGALAIDASRIAYASEADRAAMSAGVEAIRAKGGQWEHSWANTCDLSGANPAHENGRWPANVLLDEAAAAMLDEQSGESVSTPFRANVASGGILPFSFRTAGGFSDSGGASRFFYTAKASRSEREAGCEGFEERITNTNSPPGTLGSQSPRAGANRNMAARNHHPTVKPLALTTYVARLLLPPPGARPRRLLVPFSGSGSEVIGALLAGWDEVVGVEMSQEYIAIATARLKHWAKRTAPKKKTTKPQPRKTSMPVQMEMFG